MSKATIRALAQTAGFSGDQLAGTVLDWLDTNAPDVSVRLERDFIQLAKTSIANAKPDLMLTVEERTLLAAIDPARPTFLVKHDVAGVGASLARKGALVSCFHTKTGVFYTLTPLGSEAARIARAS